MYYGSAYINCDDLPELVRKYRLRKSLHRHHFIQNVISNGRSAWLPYSLEVNCFLATLVCKLKKLVGVDFVQLDVVRRQRGPYISLTKLVESDTRARDGVS